MSARKFKFGSITIDAQAYGSQGNAILGIRDSGKTYTATELAEHLFDCGIPFITFDPTGVWRWLRVPGKGKEGRGYPVVVAGGKAGDLPLTVSGAVEIVRAAMKNGVSLVIDLTDPNLSKADWKRIVKSCVRTLLQENTQHGLRHIFIEEAAEFVPQRVIDGDVYAEVEKLARIGGNSRLGYTLINQRSQEVNKAVLELCENLFLHRQKGKNAIQSLDHWLEIADVPQEEIIKSLPRLPSGHCWAWMGGNEKPTLVQVPAKHSFHPDRRALHGVKGGRVRKGVNVGNFVKDMKAALTELEKEAAENDPKILKDQVAKLKIEKAQLEKKVAAAIAKPVKPSKDAIAAAEKRGLAAATKTIARLRSELEAAMKFIVQINAKDFFKAGGDKIDKKAIEKAIADATEHVKKLAEKHLDTRSKEFNALRRQGEQLAQRLKSILDQVDKNIEIKVDVRHQEAFKITSAPKVTNGRQVPPRQVEGDGTLTRTMQSILDAIAWCESIGNHTPARAAVAFFAGSSPKSSTFEKYVSNLKSLGYLDPNPPSGCLALTEEGRARAAAPEQLLDHESAMAAVRQKLTPKQFCIVEEAVKAYPDAIERDTLAANAGMSANSSTYEKYLSQLKSFGLLSAPASKMIAATPILFP